MDYRLPGEEGLLARPLFAQDRTALDRWASIRPRPAHRRIHVLTLLTALLFLTGCGSVKLSQMVMYEDVGTEKLPMDTIPELRIRPLDIIGIQVTSNDPASVVVFQQQRATTVGSGTGSASGEGALGIQDGYRVDEEGDIHMPFIGAVTAQGKTLNELRKELTRKLDKYILNTNVQCRFMNFRVTLMGEVARPSTYTIPNERLTILEAIGMAGDFTPYAERTSVLVIRDRDNVREFARVNTQDRSVFTSPYFYLSPNDIVYVEPLKAKQYATQGDFFERYGIFLASLLSVTAILISTQ